MGLHTYLLFADADICKEGIHDEQHHIHKKLSIYQSLTLFISIHIASRRIVNALSSLRHKRPWRISDERSDSPFHGD